VSSLFLDPLELGLARKIRQLTSVHYPGSDHMAELGPGITAFFNLYYFTAGLHGVHILIGATLIGVVATMVAKGKVTGDRYTLLENSALYWHLVDLVWIFLFPLYYLIL
jgi:cytochrome c oxidase subunit 3